VCLGHQCIAEAYGGEIVRASRLMHGKASTITHNGNRLFSDLATSFEAGRYHSLVVKRTSLPACFEITAESDDGEIMAVCHREFPVHGVQFHPESVLTHDGKKILARFLTLV
jgi:anthranilate synthase/aminodeoxychorismate synthase-like glutamine amidotransferase